MILILKGQEPASLIKYKQEKYAYYDGFPHKEDIREALLIEQGHICAYCMKRIAQDTMTIEHYTAQSSNEENMALDYRNMLGVCKGNERHKYKDTTCDEHRRNALLTIDPRDMSKIQMIEYTKNGTIYSNDKAINNDVNVTLNLNCDAVGVFLKRNRRGALEVLIEKLRKKDQWTKTYLTRMKNSLKAHGKNEEYRGIMDYNIDKWLRRS